MNKHNSVPNIRFRNFKDEWTEKKISNFIIKNSDKNKNLVIKNIESISNKTGFTKQSEQFDGYRVASQDISNYYVISPNQFAYNPSRINVGSIAYKNKGEDKSIISPLYISFSTSSHINDHFLWFWFKTTSFKKQRIQFSEGGVRDTLPFENLKKMDISFPLLQEQQKIGDFFSKLDKLLDLQQQKIDKLELLKKALLQTLFPKHDTKIPELRFKGYEGDWVDRRFVNCLAKIIDFRGKTPKKLGLSWSRNGNYRALSALNVKNGFIDKNIDVHFGNYDLYKKWMGKTELKKGDILFTTEAPMGNIAIIKDNEKYILSQRTIAFRVNEKNINSLFLLYRLNTVSVKNKLMSLSTGGTAQGISQKNLSYLFISISNSLDEQKRIGNILAKVNHLIYLENKKLENLQQVKKCLLQNMFVE